MPGRTKSMSTDSKFRSCDCVHVMRGDVDFWDDSNVEGAFYWSRESYQNLTYRTLWIKMPYTAGEREHSWHCIPVVHYLREYTYNDLGLKTSAKEWPAPGAVIPPEAGRAFWKWDGNENSPTLWPSIRCCNNNWHGYLQTGRLLACD